LPTEWRTHVIAFLIGLLVSAIVLITLAARTEEVISRGTLGPTILALIFSEIALWALVEWLRTRNPFAGIPRLETTSGLTERLSGAEFNFGAISSKHPALWRSPTFLFYLQVNTVKSLIEMSRYYDVPIVYSREHRDREEYLTRTRDILRAFAQDQPLDRFTGIRLLIYDSKVLRDQESLLRSLINAHALGGIYCVPIMKERLLPSMTDTDKEQMAKLCKTIGQRPYEKERGRQQIAVPDFLFMDNHEKAPQVGDAVRWFEAGEWGTGKTADDYRTAQAVFKSLCQKSLGAIWGDLTASDIDRVAIPDRRALLRKFFSLDYFQEWITQASWEFEQWFQMEADILRGIPPGSYVLDVGSGFGRHMKLLTEHGVRVAGVDNNWTMLEKATRGLLYDSNNKHLVEVFLEDAQEMHFDNETFDYVICMTNTLGNMPDIEQQVLNEMARVVKRSGQVIVVVYANPRGLLEKRQQEYREVGLTIDSIVKGTIITREGLISRQFAKQELEDLFAAAKLMVNVQPFNSISYICRARRA